jgi:UPF0271 protein
VSRTIDINCDCGEGFGRWALGDDEGVMDQVTTVNLACGFHAGDPLTMLTAVRQAKARGLAIGAHPGLPDLLGFGRRVMDWRPEEALASIAYQIGAMRGILDAEDVALHHVKLHGVLPGMVDNNEALAAAAVEAMRKSAPDALIYCPANPSSLFQRLAGEAGLVVVPEVYADMRYDTTGMVIVERAKRAVPLDEVETRIRGFLRDGTVVAIDGSTVQLRADSISLHGDAANAPAVAGTTRRTIAEEGWTAAAAPQRAGSGVA